MSETPESGPASGDRGFAPPDGGYWAQPPADGGFGAQPPTVGGFGAQPPAPGHHPNAGPGHYPAAGYAPQQPYPGGYYGPPMLRPQTSGMAVAGMVLGIVSMVLFWAPFLGPLLAVMGIVFSSIGLSQSSKPGQTGTGMAVAGMVCSLITLGIWLLLVVLIASVFV